MGEEESNPIWEKQTTKGWWFRVYLRRAARIPGLDEAGTGDPLEEIFYFEFGLELDTDHLNGGSMDLEGRITRSPSKNFGHVLRGKEYKRIMAEFQDFAVIWDVMNS